MIEVVKSAIVPFSAKQMFDLVNDVNQYHQFLRWCEQGSIIKQISPTVYQAAVKISITGIKVAFITENTIKNQADEWFLELLLKEGPFSKLQGHWHFKQLSTEGSKVQLKLNYEINSRAINRLFAKAFGSIANRMVADFVKRAEQLYG